MFSHMFWYITVKIWRYTYCLTGQFVHSVYFHRKNREERVVVIFFKLMQTIEISSCFSFIVFTL